MKHGRRRLIKARAWIADPFFLFLRSLRLLHLLASPCGSACTPTGGSGCAACRLRCIPDARRAGASADPRSRPAARPDCNRSPGTDRSRVRAGTRVARRLDALGDDAQAQAVRERDDRFHDRGVVRVRHEFAHEAAIDLEFVEREAPQVAQARIARAEIVDRNVHAHLCSATCSVGDRLLRIVHDRAFGELEFEIAGLEPRVIERRLHERRKIGVPELLRGQIHRDADGRHVRNRSSARIWRQASRSTHSPIGAMSPFSSAIGIRRIRRHQTRARMPPAEERLGAAHAIRRDVHLRLIVQLELTLLRGRGAVRIRASDDRRRARSSRASRDGSCRARRPSRCASPSRPAGAAVRRRRRRAGRG